MMTPEQAAKLIPIIQAIADGKTVQAKMASAPPISWYDLPPDSMFLGLTPYEMKHEFRVKPEPPPSPQDEKAFEEWVALQTSWIAKDIWNALRDCQKRVVELEQDKARLDWLESKSQDYCISFAYFSSGRIDLVIKNPDTSIVLAVHSQESLRQAIDAAMKTLP